MHNAKRTILWLVITTGAAFGFSNLSVRYPFGLPLGSASGATVNMGGAATGVLDDHNVLLPNPANLGGINKTAFSALLSFDMLRISEASHHSNHLTVAPRQISFAFPLGVVGVVGMSLAKETDCGVKYQTDSSRIDALNFYGKLAYDRAGGLTGWRVGWGRRIGKWAYVGATYERLYFELNGTRLVDLASYAANSTRDSTQVHFTGNGIVLGLMVPIGKVTVGAAGRYVFRDDVRYSRGLYRLGESAPFGGSGSTSESRVHVPPSARLGLSYRFSPQWLAATDIGVERWAGYSAHGLLPEVSRPNAVSFGAGGQFVPAPELLAPKYWETIHYRAGFRVAQLPRQDNAEFAFSLGAGLPVKGGGLIDLVLSFGRRADSSFPDYNEDFMQFGIGINGGRKWIKVTESNY